MPTRRGETAEFAVPDLHARYGGGLPRVGFAALSGTGKTTLLRALIPCLKDRGLRLAVIKHAHHEFDVDHPGKDSYVLRKAGAEQMLIASAHRRVHIVDNAAEREPRLSELLDEIDPRSVDLVLVEGFKREHLPKIELHRPSLRRPLRARHDANIVAVATDAPLQEDMDVQQLDLNSPTEVADFVVACLQAWRTGRAEAGAADAR